MEKKSYVINKIALVVLCVLSLAMIATNIIRLCIEKLPLNLILVAIVSIVIYLAIMYYALFAYKKPHGNELKIIILFCMAFSLFKTLGISVVVDNEISISMLVNLSTMFVAVILMSYVAGRLDRIKENKIIFLVVLGLILISNVCLFIAPGGAPAQVVGTGVEPVAKPANFAVQNIALSLDQIIQFVTLMAAYLSRYTLHKEAGMKDK